MEIGTERTRPKNVCISAFNGIKRDTIREIDLILTIGPVDFEVTFQVLDMDTSYNFLLGRPWIHEAEVVPSTLHQMVKFEHEDQEIVFHGENQQSIYRDPSVPYLEAKEGSEHIVYQAFEIVVVDQCEGTPCPKPFFSNASIMVASKMIRTFAKLKYTEEEEDEAFTAEQIEDICGAMRQMLYEAHMVQPGEGSSTAKVLMNEDDVEKTTFTTPWGTYYYMVMPFGLKNAGATYMRAMISIFHDMMHKEVEVYVDDVIIKSITQDDHV
ncbi:uncharacterized protein [Nicotiana sylvestris]|uniref:uncharacterized protein n=1 Tax=Nicotiana sylvestris TaxID=4096 RepID=UPI00388C5909